MTILTDKVGYANYFDKNNRRPIEVYDLVLGQTSFIELDQANRFEHSRHIHRYLKKWIYYRIIVTT